MFASQQTEETEPEQRRGDTKKTQCRTTQKHTQNTLREEEHERAAMENRHVGSCVCTKEGALSKQHCANYLDLWPL